MKTLYEEAFYEGIYQLDEVKYALSKIKKVVEDLEKEVTKLKAVDKCGTSSSLNFLY